MHEPYLCDTKQIYLQLDNSLQFRLSRIEEIKDFSFTKTSTEER